MENIIDTAFKFLWSGKKDKIKRKTIIADYCNGGLKMLDLKTFIIAQRAMWVKRLSKTKQASWKAFPEYVLNAIIGMDSFKTQLDTKTNNNNITPFYWTILKSWNLLQNHDYNNLEVHDIRRQWLWMNKNIKIDKKEIKWKSWIEKDVKIIHDILDKKGNFYTIKELEQKYNIKCDMLKYSSLKDAIPKLWRNKLKTEEVEQNVILSNESPSIEINEHQVNIGKITNKMIYWELIEKIRITPIIKDKWIKEFNIPEDYWENIFEAAKIIRDTKIRTFQYKLIFNLTPCNLYLFKIGKSNTHTCHHCDAVDHIVHYFYGCNETNSFWIALQTWWNKMENENIIITKEMALLGTNLGEIENEKLNACLQLARWHIYIEKLNGKSPFLYKYLCLLKYKIKIEKIICQNNNQTKFYKKLWQDIEIYID
jgi:hypothetical protein